VLAEESLELCTLDQETDPKEMALSLSQLLCMLEGIFLNHIRTNV
jgi:hypothetical protein